MRAAEYLAALLLASALAVGLRGEVTGVLEAARGVVAEAVRREGR